ncbi:MAG TPA: hypothetical protein VLM91_03455 [Candidatus Methylomirabilis sp.]|nr:hypothetical protein [Candidatus Methylomirabilis sp.]
MRQTDTTGYAEPSRPHLVKFSGALKAASHPVTMAGTALVTILLLMGCSGIGPSTVSRDRFDYTAAVAESWKSQMLLNLVKLRYSDTPVFLDVGQIVSGYTVQSTFSANGNIFNTSGVVPGVPNSSIGLSAQGQFTDRPTITYAPLMGERFARSLMTPIPPPAILSLIQAGYPIDLTLRLVVHTINGIQNRFGGAARRRPADPEFYEVLARLRRIQDSGAIGLRVQRVGREEAVLLTLRGKVDPSIETDIMIVRQLLGLDPQAGEFRVVYGAVAADNKEVAMLTRSILDILIDLASFIEVPETHVRERRVTPTAEPEVGPGGPIPPLVRILSSTEKPGDAFVAVPYRDQWYWIDDRDMPSKSLFSFLMFIFTLVETGDKGAPPIVTIPAG